MQSEKHVAETMHTQLDKQLLGKKILVIDDSRFFLEQIKDILTDAGYQVLLASNGEEGLALVRKEKPDMVILDIVMPGMDGFAVCGILRASESNNLMPIIMLTAENDTEKKLYGLELGADDYITKPFDSREIISRIRNTLRRIERNRAASPLTGLCGNIEIQREIISRIEKNDPYAIVYADLNEFKAYNDVYGFGRGDLMIKLTADIISDQVNLFGTKDDFIGHIGGDDFIFVTVPDCVDEICHHIIEQFDERVKELYDAKDIKAGYIRTLDRKGEKHEYKIGSISLAAITNIYRRFDEYEDITKCAAQLKKKVKELKSSGYLKDRRRGNR